MTRNISSTTSLAFVSLTKMGNTQNHAVGTKAMVHTNPPSHTQEPPHSPSSVNVQGDNQKQGEEGLSSPSSCNSALEKLIRYLTKENWSFFRGEHAILTHVTGKNGSYRIILDAREESNPNERILLVYVTSPVKVPAEKRLVVAEYTTRANWGVVVGNFEMDFRDGEVRYKGCLEYADGELTDEMMELLIHKCAAAMDTYFPGLMRIIYSDVDAVTAIRPVEPQQGDGLAYAPTQAVEAVALDNTNDANNGEESEMADIGESPVLPLLEESSSSEDATEGNTTNPANE